MNITKCASEFADEKAARINRFILHEGFALSVRDLWNVELDSDAIRYALCINRAPTSEFVRAWQREPVSVLWLREIGGPDESCVEIPMRVTVEQARKSLGETADVRRRMKGRESKYEAFLNGLKLGEL